MATKTKKKKPNRCVRFTVLLTESENVDLLSLLDEMDAETRSDVIRTLIKEKKNAQKADKKP